MNKSIFTHAWWFMRVLLIVLWLIMTNKVYAENKIHNLVEPVSYFVNHFKTLRELKANLSKYKKSSLVGMSGIGKTQVARTYAYDQKDEYSIIWFFDCNLDIDSQFVKLAKIINEKRHINLSIAPSSSREEVMKYLENKDNWLLVFDNLKVGDNKKVMHFSDWENNGHVVFCSQESEGLSNIIEILKFEERDTKTLAQNILQNSDEDVVRFLQETFQGYPILVVQGAQLLNHVKGLDKETYKKKIYQSSDKIRANILLASEKLSKTSRDLLDKIALINNQSFSRLVLEIITDNPNTLDEDIYELTKLAMISNIEWDNNSPIFEMHDVLVNNIQDINGENKNLKLLESITKKFTGAIPKNVVESQVFRARKTVFENLQILEKNSAKYKISPLALMELKLHLLTQYINNFDLNSSRTLVEWFANLISEDKLKLTNMSEYEKGVYARYLGIVGWYYRKILDFYKAIDYFDESLKICKGVKGLEAFECNAYFGLSITYISLGRVKETEISLASMEKMFSENLVPKSDLGTLYSAKARLYFVQGDYKKSLDYVIKTISRYIANGDKTNDLLFSELYLMRAEIFTSLGKYNDAIKQLEHLLEMHKASKNKTIFARIYTQFARSTLGLKQIDAAEDYIQKALEILDSRIGTKEQNPALDPHLALLLKVRGDVLFVKGVNNDPIDSYRDAQYIYFYLYKDNRKYVAEVSELYLAGAKASCRAKDLYHYKCFGEPQIKEFGRDHPNSIAMLEYCEKYDMNLWSKN